MCLPTTICTGCGLSTINKHDDDDDDQDSDQGQEDTVCHMRSNAVNRHTQYDTASCL